MTSASFSRLPLSVFSLIRDYFIHSSIDTETRNLELFRNWRDFLNCNKAVMWEIKRHYVYYTLSPYFAYAYVFSFDYADRDPGNDERLLSHFGKRQLFGLPRIHSILKNPSSQVFLEFCWFGQYDVRDLFIGETDEYYHPY